jgi:hypothetical protein
MNEDGHGTWEVRLDEGADFGQDLRCRACVAFLAGLLE